MAKRGKPKTIGKLFGAGQLQPRSTGPVECLGQTFANDVERREHFLGLLREKLREPGFRDSEGFPVAPDEAILAMSDPPYYTACPNPWLEDFVRLEGKPYDPSVAYNRKPFAVDVNEGKTDPVYKAHSYHTKVPHLAIVPSILHYTEPGDVVLDGFCGSGMTGMAAQCCGTADARYREKVEASFKEEGLPAPQWGARKAVLNDLSPAATFIAANYNLPFDVHAFAEAGRMLLDEVEAELGWMYETRHTDGSMGRIEFTVWSEVFTCPDCAGEVVFFDEAFDKQSKRVKDIFPCPHCGAELSKNNLQRVFETTSDPATGSMWKRVKFKPVLISYIAGGQRYEKPVDLHDIETLKRIERMLYPTDAPLYKFPIEQMEHGSRLEPKGFDHVHQLFLPRVFHTLAALWRKASEHEDLRVQHMLLFFVEQAIWSTSLLNRYRPTGFSQVNQYMTGVYYIASQHAECSPWYVLGGKLERLISAFSSPTQGFGYNSFLSLGSAAGLSIPANSIDYIFTDPPFGENIPYADLNILIEAWHRVTTCVDSEAIVDRHKNKDLLTYQNLMHACFKEYCRVLKPGRWMTVVFHNSRNAVWNAIQEALQEAGFVVADVRTMDKQQGSYRQVTSTAVKQDLVISAYKPNGGLEERFKLIAGTEDGAWDFVATHLKQLPVFVSKGGRAEVVAERQNYRLYDRMVAFHVQRNVLTPPLSPAEFNAKLPQHFDERDGMYFLPEQAAEYDRKSRSHGRAEQLVMFVTDESSARQWLQQQLAKKPQTFQELHPQFLREIAGWQKHEEMLELSDLLKQYFLCYDDQGDVPSQIHSYLSSNYKELRNLAKDVPELKAKAKDRWYVPDPNRESDLEKIREKRLLREFESYRSAPRRLKSYRGEAMRAGFKKAWQERDYDTIIAMADKIPEKALQEDRMLHMWYSMAQTRKGED